MIYLCDSDRYARGSTKSGERPKDRKLRRPKRDFHCAGNRLKKRYRHRLTRSYSICAISSKILLIHSFIRQRPDKRSARRDKAKGPKRTFKQTFSFTSRFILQILRNSFPMYFLNCDNIVMYP